MVTSRDVALAAGVSQATVSRTFSGVGGVSEKARARVLAAAEELGYEINFAARAMRTQRSGTIGVVVERVTNPFYPELIESISRALADNDLRMSLWDSQGAGEKGAIEAIGHKLVDGLIFTTATSTSSALTTALAAGAPVVLVNRVVDGVMCDQVDTDNVGMSARVAQYFAASGRTRAGLITGLDEASTARDRRDGFLKGAASHDVDVPRELIIDGGFSHQGGFEALQRMFAHPEPPNAVFCCNDLSAFGAVDAARSMNLRVPEDLWIAGYDDVDMASWTAYSLTTVRQPMDDMARVAIQLLLDRLGNRNKPSTHHRFPGELVVRGSTGRVPFADPAQRKPPGRAGRPKG
jgi:LacI family transcriptional regulator, galactose operon repressor